MTRFSSSRSAINILFAEKTTADKVSAYLDGCLYRAKAEGMTLDRAREIAENIGRDHFHLDNPLYNKYFSIWLYNCVKSAFEPGSEVNEMLILHGGAAIGKSTFVRIMGGDFTSEPELAPSMTSKHDNPNRESIAHSWIVNFDEIGILFFSRNLKKQVTRLKELSASAQMEYRPYYERENKQIPRIYNLFGSSDEPKLLPIIKASEGEGIRFMVVQFAPGLYDLSDKALDHEKLEAHRDLIWGAFTMVYKAGGAYQLADEDKWTVAD